MLDVGVKVASMIHVSPCPSVEQRVESVNSLFVLFTSTTDEMTRSEIPVFFTVTVFLGGGEAAMLTLPKLSVRGPAEIFGFPAFAFNLTLTTGFFDVTGFEAMPPVSRNPGRLWTLKCRMTLAEREIMYTSLSH